MASSSPFRAGLVRFLRDLEANNNRPWFEANRERYEEQVREPALEFIRAMAPHLKKISPHVIASDKKVGGSLLRLHRDVRFSKSKLPYKTNVGIRFPHVDARDIHAPGLYFHVDTQGVFLGVGMWHPAPDALAAVRDSIVEDPKRWCRVRDAKRFRELWNFEGDSLKRAPRGYPADHPCLDDLRRKDHIAVARLQPSELTRSDLVRRVVALYVRGRGLLAWQAAALGISF